MSNALGTVALPGMLQPRITQGARIAVGEKDATKKIPSKLDHIRLAKWDTSVGDGSYVMDAEAMQLLAQWYGVPYDREFAPKRVPIWLLANPEAVPDPVTPGVMRPEIPQSILWTRMARYGKGGAICACEGFKLLPRRDAEQLGLAWPLDPAKRESWRGMAIVRDRDNSGRVTTHRHVCYPPLCPYANGVNGIVTCKPQTVFRCVLPFMPALGVVAEYHTTSWQATERLRGSLLKIAAFSGGWLMMLGNPDAPTVQPFIELVMVDRRVGGNNYHSPILHAEYRGTMNTLGEATIATRHMLGDLQTRLAAIEAPEGPLALDSGEEAYAWQHEMLPESLHDEGGQGIEALARDYARRARWSDAKLVACIRKHGDDEAAWDGVLEELQRELGLPVFQGEEEAPVQGIGYAPAPEDEQPAPDPEEAQDAEFEDEVESYPEEFVPETSGPDDEEPTDRADECFPQEQEEPSVEAYDDPPVAPYEDVDELPADYAEVFPEAPEVQQAAAKPKQQRKSTKPQRLFGGETEQ